MTDARNWQSEGGTPGSGRARRLAGGGEGGADPTDPEVPDAKRRRAIRRRRSMVVAATAVAALLVIALLLIYRMGRQVTNTDAETYRAAIPSPATESSLDGAPLPMNAPVLASPARSGVSAEPQATTSGSAVSPQPRRKPAAAPDIFHKPAF
jgi:hypothetical protein